MNERRIMSEGEYFYQKPLSGFASCRACAGGDLYPKLPTQESMTDILERLRRVRCDSKAGCNTLPECACVLMDEAADEIKRLREEVERLENQKWWDY